MGGWETQNNLFGKTPFRACFFWISIKRPVAVTDGETENVSVVYTVRIDFERYIR